MSRRQFRRRPDQGRHHRRPPRKACWRRSARSALRRAPPHRPARAGGGARRRAGRDAPAASARLPAGAGRSRAPAARPSPISSSPRGVKYVFGNSASEDAQFYEALVDRPQLKYILTPHEGPGAAMAAGYIKASGEPAIVMQAAVVGMANAIGQMINAFKEQTPLVVYSYRTDQTAPRRPRRLRGGAEPGADRPADHQVHLARAPRRHDPGDHPPRVQGVMDAAVRPVLHLVALGLQRRRASAPTSSRRTRSIRACGCGPIREEVERAAKLLVEAQDAAA